MFREKDQLDLEHPVRKMYEDFYDSITELYDMKEVADKNRLINWMSNIYGAKFIDNLSTLHRITKIVVPIEMVRRAGVEPAILQRL